MLVENSFEVKSRFSRVGHNFNRFCRPRLRHFEFGCCCNQIICIFFQNFSCRLLDPELLVHLRAYWHNLQVFYFRSIPKYYENSRQSPNRRGGENRRRRMRTSLVLNSHKEKEEGKFSRWNGRFGQ